MALMQFEPPEITLSSDRRQKLSSAPFTLLPLLLFPCKQTELRICNFFDSVPVRLIFFVSVTSSEFCLNLRSDFTVPKLIKLQMRSQYSETTNTYIIRMCCTLNMLSSIEGLYASTAQRDGKLSK
jgi:hypothetical protein